MHKQLVSDGLVVRVQGHPAVVSNTHVEIINDEPAVRFTADFLNVPENESVINTGYNHSTYGGNRQSEYAW